MTDPSDDRPAPDKDDDEVVQQDMNAAMRDWRRSRLPTDFFNPPPDGNTAA